jgi:membrane associated rhomboid family serine protease
MGDGYGGKWVAEERIRPWEASFPTGTSSEFIATLAAQTPSAWATPLLVGLNALLFVAMTLGGVDPWSPAAADLISWGANYGSVTTGGDPSRLLMSAFLNLGALQIVLNMVGLWYAGFVIERLVGSWGFLIAYLVSAFCASVAAIAWNPYLPAVGASGAVLGVYGAFIGYLSVNRRAVPSQVVARLRALALMFLVLTVVLGACRSGIDPTAPLRALWAVVDLVTLLGGLLAGVCGGRVLARPFGTPTTSGALGRNLSLLGGGLAVAAIALVFTPRTIDLSGEMAELYAMQAQTSELYESARWKRQKRQISDADFVKIVDEQVRPPWRQHLRRLQALPRLRGKVKERVVMTEAYLDLRERSWSKASDAVRTGNAAEAAEARALEVEADKMARSFGG